MPLIAAIDPGYEISAYIEWDGKQIYQYGIWDNSRVLDYLRLSIADYLFIEKMIWGEKVGKEILDTVFWSGRFYQIWIERKINQDKITHMDDIMIPRSVVKKHFRAKDDSEVRKALIERYGKQTTKPCKSHLWQALGLAAWALETNILEND